MPLYFHDVIKCVVRCTCLSFASIFIIVNRQRYYFLPRQYSVPEGKILKTKQERPQRRLLGGESPVEVDRISPLESHRQPLEQVGCFPGVFSDVCHSSAHLLHQFHCLLLDWCDFSDAVTENYLLQST